MSTSATASQQSQQQGDDPAGRASSRVSVQLYTVREALADDVAGTVARLAALGFASVEPFGPLALSDELATALAEHDIAAPTMHQGFVGSDDDALDALFAAAAARGTTTVIDPFTAPDRWRTREDVEAVAAELAAAAGVAARHGVRVGYHNHSQEFVASFGGVSAYEFFADQLRDDVVLEVDLYWAATGKQDVPALLGRLGDKVKALHLKDGVVGEDPFQPGAERMDATKLDQRPAGEGDLPLLDYLAAAPATEYGVIEFDHYAGGHIYDGIEASVRYFNAHGLK